LLRRKQRETFAANRKGGGGTTARSHMGATPQPFVKTSMQDRNAHAQQRTNGRRYLE
jgi:hypothetical protein